MLSCAHARLNVGINHGFLKKEVGGQKFLVCPGLDIERKEKEALPK